MRAFVKKGYIKAENFKNARKKSAYLYMLTPKGIEEKARVTVRFLRHKMAEYDRIKKELAELYREALKTEVHPPDATAGSRTGTGRAQD